MEALHSSWKGAWAKLGVEQADLTVFTQLVAAYCEPHRKYHSLQHLIECLQTFATVSHLAEYPGEVELALWFHDAVYDVHSKENEQNSALWAYRVLQAAGVSEQVTTRVQNLILATQHVTTPSLPDEQLIVDIDLSILGASKDRFAEYEAQIREEYAWVPISIYCTKRREILENFISRPFIYSTAHFRSLLEKSAYNNLLLSIQLLSI